MNKKFIVSLIIAFLVGLAVFLFILTKAHVSSFTHDESYTYNFYVHSSFMDILSHKNSYTNNHLLNTLLMKYSEMLFGSSELALRLPNLIMYLVFCVYLFLLFKRSDPWLRLSVFIIIIANVGLIDFFGLARGYGISIGFMVMSLYHLVQSFYSKNKIHLLLFNLAALMAILGNFTLLDYYLAAILTFNCIKFYEYRFVSKKQFNFYDVNKINLLLFLFMFIVLYEPVRRVVTFNQFDFGGTTGFMNDTLQALVITVFSHTHIGAVETVIIKALILLLLTIPLLIIMKQIYNRKTEFFEENKPLIIVNLILIAIFVEIIMQHLLLKTDYLIGRFALFLFPLFIINMGFFLEYSLKFKVRNGILTAGILVAMLSASNFYRHADLYSCAEWGYDMETKNAMKALTAWHEQDGTKQENVKLGINWLFEPAINFYRTTWNINWLLPVDRKALTTTSDYYYVFKSDLENLKLKNYKIIFSSDNTNTVLVKNDL